MLRATLFHVTFLYENVVKSKIQRRDHGLTIIIGRESRKIMCIVFAGRKLSFPLPLASVSIASVEARRPASSSPRLFLYPNSLFVLMAYTFEKRVSSFLFFLLPFSFFFLFFFVHSMLRAQSSFRQMPRGFASTIKRRLASAEKREKRGDRN